jgi:transcriptional regulator with XRE-family HTH domain
MSDAFGRRLRAYRKLKHWTQLELANQIGVSVAIVGTLERGTREPDALLIGKLTEVLHVSEQELLGKDPKIHTSLDV